MSNYTKTTDFDVKDSLPSGDTGKIIRGSEFEVEFENIEVAIASKADSLNAVLTGNTSVTNLSVTGNTTLGSDAADTVTISGDVAVDTNTLFVDVSENKVGIGTTTPATALDVTGTTTTDGLTVNTAQGNVTVPSTSSSLDFARAGSSYIRATDAAGNFRFITGANDFTSTRLFLTNNGDVSFFEDTGVTAKFFWDASSERLGVGTSSPATNLHVSDATEAQIYLSDTGGAGATSANSQLVFTHGAGNTNNAYIGNDQNVVTGAFSMGTLVNYPMSFVINSSEVMRIETSGNVGIGTNNASAKLDVADSLNPTIRLKSTLVGNDPEFDDQYMGGLEWYTSDTSGIGPHIGASIRAFSDSSLTSTTPAYALTFSTARPNAVESERMRIDADGNVGIGTDDPTSVLHVNRPTTEGLVAQFDSAGSSARTLEISSFNSGAAGSGWDFNAASTGGVFTFSVNSDEKVRINTDGNVGIGTTNPAADLEVSSDANTKVRISDSTNVNQRFEISHNAGFTALTAGNNAAKGVLAFYQYDGTDTTEAMRIDLNGNVGIGISSPSAQLHLSKVGGTLIKLGTSNNASEIEAREVGGANSLVLSANNSTDDLVITGAGNVGIGTDAPSRKLSVRDVSATPFISIVGSQSSVPGLLFGDADSDSIGQIRYDNTDNSMAFTTSNTQKMAITASGNLLVGVTSAQTGTENTSDGWSVFPDGTAVSAKTSTTANIYVNKIGEVDGTAIQFNRNGVSVGTITVDGTAPTTNYNTSSDVRLKENITDAPEGNVDALQVRSFDWKADGSHQEYGFIAQELEAVAPYAVTKGETEEDMWGVDYSKLVPMLVKEIQDLKARIATLEAN